MWAPYHAVDIYVRGAMNESWALVWFPAICLLTLKLIRGVKQRSLSGTKLFFNKYTALLSVSWFALLTSHNLMVIIFTPVYAGSIS